VPVGGISGITDRGVFPVGWLPARARCL